MTTHNNHEVRRDGNVVSRESSPSPSEPPLIRKLWERKKNIFLTELKQLRWSDTQPLMPFSFTSHPSSILAICKSSHTISQHPPKYSLTPYLTPSPSDLPFLPVFIHHNSTSILFIHPRVAIFVSEQTETNWFPPSCLPNEKQQQQQHLPVENTCLSSLSN